MKISKIPYTSPLITQPSPTESPKPLKTPNIKLQESTPKTKKDIVANMKTIYKIYQIAQNIPKEQLKNMPNPQEMATYVESLKSYMKDNPQISDQLAYLIENLPSPTQIKKDLSIEECKILYETVGYAWKKITGLDITEEAKITKAPESLFGNYWMLKNGVLLHGTNHFTIAKQNSAIIPILLNVNGFAFQQYMASKPNKLIRFLLENGAMRIFINKNKKAYFQMSPKTYADWGRAKVKGLDFDKKTVKIVDFKVEYKGWKSGVTVKL